VTAPVLTAILAIGLTADGLAVAQPAPAPVPAVDHHQHLFSPATIALAPAFKTVTAADLVTLLDEAGIRRAAVFSVAYQFGSPNSPARDDEYALVKAENDWTSRQISPYLDRLVGFCGVNPLRDYALEELARCANDPNLRAGLKLHFGNSDVDLDNPRHVDALRRVFAAANARRMAIVIHMRSSISRQRPYGANEARIFLSQVLPAAPDIPVQIAHLTGAGGYDDPLVDEALSVFVEAAAGHDPLIARLYFDVSGIAGIGRWSDDKADRVASRIRQLGVDRVLFGSDGANGGNFVPKDAWAAFRKLPRRLADPCR
jgi:predicted TIM-barrel fold metal-dependent hydrolase